MGDPGMAVARRVGGWSRVGSLGLLVSVSLTATPVRGQSVYRWTDERGVVHFSDQPPPGGTKFELRDMPPAPRPVPATPAAGESPVAGVISEAAATPKPRAKTRAARVEITEHEAEPAGNGVQDFSGTVENVGGSVAEDVVVVITVTEPVQGAQCLREEIDVDPSTLPPGDSGTFSVRLQNPCFLGPTTVDIRPEWR